MYLVPVFSSLASSPPPEELDCWQHTVAIVQNKRSPTGVEAFTVLVFHRIHVGLFGLSCTPPAKDQQVVCYNDPWPAVNGVKLVVKTDNHLTIWIECKNSAFHINELQSKYNTSIITFGPFSQISQRLFLPFAVIAEFWFVELNPVCRVFRTSFNFLAICIYCIILGGSTRLVLFCILHMSKLFLAICIPRKLLSS